MFYDFAITVTANTLEAEPKTETLKLAKGYIHRVEVEQYSGCHRYVGCRLYHGTKQIYPSNPQGEFKTDGYTVAFNDLYEFKSPPYELVFKGYSDGSSYDHVVVVRVGVLENRFITGLIKLISGLSKFFTALGVKV